MFTRRQQYSTQSVSVETDLAEAANQEAANLEQSGQMSSGGTKKLRYQTRKLTQKLPDLSR